MARSVDGLKVYQKARLASTRISKIILRPCFRNDTRLRGQIGAASERVPSLIAEGFEQSTDRDFVQYCYRARGSCGELRSQLAVAFGREFVTADERDSLSQAYVEIARMLSALIEHLAREGSKHGRRSPTLP